MAIDYATSANTSGAFPDVVSNNVTAPGAGDGTPYTKAVIDDLWGFAQAVLTYGGLTPTGVTESSSNSQRLNALRDSLSPVGTIVGWHGNDSPSVFGARLLELQGQGVLRTSYPDLDAACWVGGIDNHHAESYFRANDAAGAVRNPGGAYLILPDARGKVLRGIDTSGIHDPDGSTRIFPDTQGFALEEHAHYVTTIFGDYLKANEATSKDGGGAGTLDLITAATTPGASALTQVIANYDSPATNTAVETRMVNLQVKWCVRY